MSCKDNISDTCGGKKVNAVCVKYEGGLSENSALDPNDCHNAEEVIEDLNAQLDKLKADLDLSELGNACLSYDQAGVALTVKEAILKLEEKLCLALDKLGIASDNCESCESCPPVFTEDFSCLNLDLGALSDACSNPITNLKDLLQAMVTKLNTL